MLTSNKVSAMFKRMTKVLKVLDKKKAEELMAAGFGCFEERIGSVDEVIDVYTFVVDDALEEYLASRFSAADAFYDYKLLF